MNPWRGCAYIRPNSGRAARENGFPRALLSLSDRELEIVMAAFAPLAPAARSEFLSAIAERVSGVGEVGDGLLSRCCRELQPRYLSPPDLSHESRWGRETSAQGR